MMSKKGLAAGFFSAALVLSLGITPGVALGQSVQVNDLDTDMGSIVEELVQLNPGSSKNEGLGVYPVDILNSGWTITYYIYGK